MKKLQFWLGVLAAMLIAGTVFTAVQVDAAQQTLVTNQSGAYDAGGSITSNNAKANANFTELYGYTDALVAENADGAVFVSPHAVHVVSGTWTSSYATAQPILTHTANAGAEVATFDVPLLARETASKGRKITSVDCWYSIDTADLDDVTVELIQVTGTADGTIPTAAVVTATYDTAHDTAPERGDDTGAPEQHKLTITVDTPAYAGAEEGYVIRLTVDGDAGPSGVFVLYGFRVNYTEQLVDRT